MTADPNGWPDAERPGVPMNPEVDGWHWLHHPEDLRPIVAGWQAELHGWPSGELHSPQGIVDLGYRYLGPALLPSEVKRLREEVASLRLTLGGRTFDASVPEPIGCPLPGACQTVAEIVRLREALKGCVMAHETGSYDIAAAIRALTEKQAAREGGG